MRNKASFPGCKNRSEAQIAKAQRSPQGGIASNLHPSITTCLLICVAVVLSLINPAQAGEKTIERNGTRFRTYVTSSDAVRIFWLDAQGKPYQQFRKLQDALTAQGKKLKFVMNAGIFEEGGIPSGLLVADRKTQNPLNVSPGEGNFFLQPNGVFYTDSRGGHVVSTADYLAQKPSPHFAVQSGPLLLRHGLTHPAFRAESPNRLHRNGVGILPDGRVLFAITEFRQAKHPNLHEFADFFRSQGCRDALFLDGDISQMMVDPPVPITPGNYFGAIIAVTE